MQLLHHDHDQLALLSNSWTPFLWCRHNCLPRALLNDSKTASNFSSSFLPKFFFYFYKSSARCKSIITSQIVIHLIFAYQIHYFLRNNYIYIEVFKDNRVMTHIDNGVNHAFIANSCDNVLWPVDDSWNHYFWAPAVMCVCGISSTVFSDYLWTYVWYE